ncbi:MAG: sulfatase-like hydrolase/transferase [bacterium]|uniref:Sulfatase N-terminal domain-containing protein n=1 Tax=candidate division WOR-3 bacterium TaxID=2052148 RepID=A0A348MMU4_UNCW3|nr:MAG: Sulfatase [candidate division TA06 bacterium 32_111]MDI6699935.1 sulfatase-like hydrolase/transferase [bacterium]HAF08370.1 hypothetical protein [candidate division WOR-3 bacterium]HCP15937.1 hypothetical protein [candidate division WOR-3 bacterium]
MKNIILILIDGARYDFVKEEGLYKEIFSKSLWYNRFYTASPYTIGSMHALFTGLYPKNNGVDGYFNPNKLKREVKILPQYLKEKGYFTLANIPSPVVMANRGFDIYTLHDEYNEDVEKKQIDFVEENREKMLKSKPFFLYLHYSKIHTSLVNNVLNVYNDRSEEYFNNVEKNRERYKNDIKISGDYLKKIINLVKDSKLYENTEIWVLSDHGASTGEVFGERAYGVFLYNYTLHNFVIKYREDRREDDYRLHSTVDLLPILLNSLGIEIPLNIDGRLEREYVERSFFKERKKVYEIYFETGGVDGPFPSPEKHNIFGVFDGERKLVHIKTIDKFQQFLVKDENDIEVKNIDKDLKNKLIDYEKG